MKILFSRYNHLVLKLTDLCFTFGFLDVPIERICISLGIKGRPKYPSRKCISIVEMKRLVNYLEFLLNHPTKLYLLVKRTKPSIAQLVYQTLS